jgi:hypothetical protein
VPFVVDAVMPFPGREPAIGASIGAASEPEAALQPLFGAVPGAHA